MKLAIRRRDQIAVAVIISACVVLSSETALATDPLAGAEISFKNLVVEHPLGQAWLPTYGFSQPNTEFSRGHRGVDFSAKPGQPVYAPVSGIVNFSGWVGNRSVVSIRAEAVTIELEPVCAQVTRGESIDSGQEIGQVCVDKNYGWHCADPPCLHLSTKARLGYLNPLWFVKPVAPSHLIN